MKVPSHTLVVALAAVAQAGAIARSVRPIFEPMAVEPASNGLMQPGMPLEHPPEDYQDTPTGDDRTSTGLPFDSHPDNLENFPHISNVARPAKHHHHENTTTDAKTSTQDSQYSKNPQHRVLGEYELRQSPKHSSYGLYQRFPKTPELDNAFLDNLDLLPRKINDTRKGLLLYAWDSVDEAEKRLLIAILRTAQPVLSNSTHHNTTTQADTVRHLAFLYGEKVAAHRRVHPRQLSALSVDEKKKTKASKYRRRVMLLTKFDASSQLVKQAVLDQFKCQRDRLSSEHGESTKNYDFISVWATLSPEQRANYLIRLQGPRNLAMNMLTVRDVAKKKKPVEAELVVDCAETRSRLFAEEDIKAFDEIVGPHPILQGYNKSPHMISELVAQNL